jgi:hypothetical protein
VQISSHVLVVSTGTLHKRKEESGDLGEKEVSEVKCTLSSML